MTLRFLILLLLSFVILNRIRCYGFLLWSTFFWFFQEVSFRESLWHVHFGLIKINLTLLNVNLIVLLIIFCFQGRNNIIFLFAFFISMLMLARVLNFKPEHVHYHIVNVGWAPSVCRMFSVCCMLSFRMLNFCRMFNFL